MSHSALLVIAGAVVTFVLAALVFRPTGTAEERRMREERKVLRALEGQRRIQAARRAQEEKRRMAVIDARRPSEPEPDDRQEIEEHAGAERRAAEHERKRRDKELAAELKAQHVAEKAASRQAEQERKEAAKAERAAERQRQQEEIAATRAEQEARVPEAVTADEETTPLAELPLFSWANRDDDPPADETR
ncbi:MAG TPA: hypothetical protein VGF66_05960 [Gaiellaceae bacterium]|jgi:uncharacterized membrane protein YgaE (UPF0421/DUF939 family)